MQLSITDTMRIGSQLLPVLLLLFVECCLSQTGFPKDENEDLIVFPPSIHHSPDSPIPVGHLRPLGWQRSPEGRVVETENIPQPDAFYEKYVLPGKPVVFRGAFKNSSALEKWTKVDYLKEQYGDIQVDVTAKKEALAGSPPRRMSLSKFLKDFRYEDLYLSNFAPLDMMSELVLPKPLQCGFRRWLMESELWMSSGGTASLLHSHADHDLHCLVAGRKDFVLIEWTQRERVGFHDKAPFQGAGHSEVDTDRINMFVYPNVATTSWIWSTLRKGDCIFIPAGFLHQVRSYGFSISSTNHFSPTPEINFSDCDKKSSETSISLADAGFLWTYTNGQLLLTNSRLNSRSMKHHLLMVLREENNLTYAMFESFYKEVMKEGADYPTVREVWAYISPSENSDQISREELKQLDDEVLEGLAEVFNIPHELLREKSNVDHDEL